MPVFDFSKNAQGNYSKNRRLFARRSEFVDRSDRTGRTIKPIVRIKPLDNDTSMLSTKWQTRGSRGSSQTGGCN
jgi:hypothetical protein